MDYSFRPTKFRPATFRPGPEKSFARETFRPVSGDKQVIKKRDYKAVFTKIRELLENPIKNYPVMEVV